MIPHFEEKEIKILMFFSTFLFLPITQEILAPVPGSPPVPDSQ